MSPETQAVERKQARRWHDWLRDIDTPLMDKVLALAPSDIRNRHTRKQLLRVAALIDTHLQRSGASQDLPQTHAAYLANFAELLMESLRRG